METRIPIDDFAHFPTARLQGYSTGIRWEACMQAMEQALRERIKAREKEEPAHVTTWQERYVDGWHHVKHLPSQEV